MSDDTANIPLQVIADLRIEMDARSIPESDRVEFAADYIRGRTDITAGQREAAEAAFSLGYETGRDRKTAETRRFNWEVVVKKTVFWTSIGAFVVLIALALFRPEPSPILYVIMRVLLALAAAGFATYLPGMLQVNISDGLKATGALGVFLVVYWFAPAALRVASVEPAAAAKPAAKAAATTVEKPAEQPARIESPLALAPAESAAIEGRWSGMVRYTTPGNSTLRVVLHISGCRAGQCRAQVENLEPFAGALTSDHMAVQIEQDGVSATFDQDAGPAQQRANDDCARSFLAHGGTWKFKVTPADLLVGTVWTRSPSAPPSRCATFSFGRVAPAS